jgi:ligand-binding sensor domain-containing protein
MVRGKLKHFLKIFLFLVAFCLPFSGKAQPVISEIRSSPEYEFKHYTTRNGLSKDRVISLYQDRFSYLWVGTTDGLNRFDGSQMRKYFPNKNDSTSILSKQITCFAEDPKGGLWIGMDKGLVKYDRKKDQFISLISPDSDPDIFPDCFVRGIHFENDSIVYIGLNEGFFVKYNFNSNTSTWKRYREDDQPYYHYYVIYEDSHDDLYIGGRSVGLFRYKKAEDSLIVIRSSYTKADSKKREADASCYLEDSHGNFWVSGLDGIYTYDRENDVFTKFFNVSTWWMTEDKLGNIWFASGGGALKYEPETQVLYRMVYNPDNPLSISDDNVRKVLVDRQNNVWFGTDAGLNLLSRPEYPFKQYQHIFGQENSISSNKINKIVQDKDGLIWIGTDGGGLNTLDPKTENFRHFHHIANDPASIRSERVSALYQDKKGAMWIGLWSGLGFEKYNKETDGFTHYTYNPNSLSEDWYYDFTEDTMGNFYLGFWGGPGLTIFDRERGEFGEEFQDYLNNTQTGRLMTDLLCDQFGMIWFGTSNNGLNSFDPISKINTNYMSNPDDPFSIAGNKINFVFEDSKGRLWIGGDGLSLFERKTDNFKNYGLSDGLCNINVKSILEDHHGIFWIGTENGLSKFDSQKEAFSSFYDYNGLPSNWFSRSATNIQDGRLAFGTNKGMVVFHPDSIVHKDDLPPIFINNFKIFDRDSIFDLSGITKLKLKYNQNFFSFEIGSIDFLDPRRLKYEYKLTGFDKNWNLLNPGRRQIRYTNVPHGKYIFQVRVGKENGRFLKTRSILISISPPFWKRWWFFAIVILIFVGLLFFVFRLRVRQLIRKRHTAELKQKLLRSQMNPHFIFNSLTAIQNYIYDKKPKEAGKYLADFASLMRQILNNSREETISLENEINYLKTYMDLQALRFEHAFAYQLDVDQELEIEFTAIPPMLAQPFIENALEHGIKNMKGNGHLLLRFALDGELILFTIEDNGIGIDAASVRTKDSKHKSMALSITKERLENINIHESRHIVLSIVDLNKIDPAKTGTRVQFSIPVCDL